MKEDALAAEDCRTPKPLCRSIISTVSGRANPTLDFSGSPTPAGLGVEWWQKNE